MAEVRIQRYGAPVVRWLCESCGEVGPSWVDDLEGEMLVRNGVRDHLTFCPNGPENPVGEPSFTITPKGTQ